MRTPLPYRTLLRDSRGISLMAMMFLIAFFALAAATLVIVLDVGVFDSATNETQRRLTALNESIQRYAADHGGSVPAALDTLLTTGTTCNLNTIAGGEAAGQVQGDCGTYFDRPAVETSATAFKRDGWAQSITINTTNSTIRSCGRDKVCNNSDDLVVSYAPAFDSSKGNKWLSVGAGLKVIARTVTVVPTATNPNNPAETVSTRWITIRTNRPLSAGKWYWEITWDTGGDSAVDATADDYWAVGVMTAGSPAGAKTAASAVEYKLGQDAESWGYYPGLAQRINNNTTVSGVGLSLPVALNTVVGVVLDMDLGYLGWQGKRPADAACGATSASAYTNLLGKVVYPAISLKASGTPDMQITAKFSSTATPFTCAIPSGYSSLD